MFMCDVEEITDLREYELRDKVIIQWEVIEVSVKTETEELEGPQEYPKHSQTSLHP
jgi:hypothetical protein